MDQTYQRLLIPRLVQATLNVINPTRDSMMIYLLNSNNDYINGTWIPQIKQFDTAIKRNDWTMHQAGELIATKHTKASNVTGASRRKSAIS